LKNGKIGASIAQAAYEARLHLTSNRSLSAVYDQEKLNLSNFLIAFS
jgi:hypothetical protein